MEMNLQDAFSTISSLGRSLMCDFTNGATRVSLQLARRKGGLVCETKGVTGLDGVEGGGEEAHISDKVFPGLLSTV